MDDIRNTKCLKSKDGTHKWEEITYLGGFIHWDKWKCKLCGAIYIPKPYRVKVLPTDREAIRGRPIRGRT